MLKSLFKITSAFLLLFLTVGLTLAQTNTGGIRGTVKDSTGAVIAGATVEVVNVGTKEKRTITTNETGTYSVPNLDPEVYEITVTASGFSTAVAKEVKVTVSFTTSVDLELKPGEASEILEVRASAEQVQINSTDQQLSTLIDNKKILELPLLSRDPSSLVLLTPGAVATNGLGGFSINGSRERNNNFQVDGIDNNDTDVPGGPGGLTTPNIDATQEFRIISNNFNAEFGRNSGAVINVATKGGTNEFHGGLYYYNRSDTFSSRNFFDTTGDSDPLHRNQFGGTIGGPIIKNKTFFFFNYEGDRFNQGFANIRAVPSLSARQGIFPNTPFGTLDIRANGANNPLGFAINPATLALLNAIYPVGNDPLNATVPGTIDAFRFIFTSRTRGDQFTTRIDHQLSAKNRLTGRYSFNRSDNKGVGAETFPGFGDVINNLQRSSLFGLTLTSVISPTIVNEARFGFNRDNQPFVGPGDGVSTKLDDAIRSAFAANGIPTAFAPFGGRNGSTFTITSGAVTGIAPFDTQRRFTGTTVIADNLTYIRGNHSFKGGFESRSVYSNSETNFNRGETLAFNLPALFGFPILVDSNGNDIPTTGIGGNVNNLASFLYGLVASQSQTQFFNGRSERTDGNGRGFRVREFDFYFQDTYRLRPNLTLNYGVRYEYKGVPYEVNGLLSTLVGQDPSGLQPQGGFKFQLVGKNSPNENLQLYNDDYNNFAPRFGFAYDPFKDGKTSIRGGYGIFYDRVFGNLFTNSRGNLPFEFGFVDFPATRSFDEAILQNVPRIPSVQTRSNAFNTDELAPVIFPSKGNNLFKQDFRNSYGQQFNFGIQRQIQPDLVVEVDYVGRKEGNLLRTIDGNLTNVARKNALTGANNAVSPSARRNYLNGSLNTAFNIAFLNLASAFSTYHALTLRVTKTLTNEKFGTGQIQGIYTYSHAIDNADDPLVAQAGQRNLPRDSSGFSGGFNRPERGEPGFDARQRVVINFIYDIPFRSENKFLRGAFGNWSMTGIIQAQDGQPFSVFGSVDSMGTGIASRAQFSPTGNDIKNDPSLNPRTQTGPLASMFRNAPLGQQGTVPRSAFVGPGFATVDYALIKRFTLAERHAFQVRADFFNLFNRANFAQPVNIITDRRFGQSVAAGQPRIIQFVLRYNF